LHTPPVTLLEFLSNARLRDTALHQGREGYILPHPPNGMNRSPARYAQIQDAALDFINRA